MDNFTHAELHQLEELLRSEQAACAKFRMFASLTNDEGVQKMCEQLTDRHREHFLALMNQFPQSSSRVH